MSTKPTGHASHLSERYIQDSFHVYLKSSLRQAKAERLLDDDVLASAEGDLMITGPALCLYFTALRCTTNPPSVPLPRSTRSKPPRELSYQNCPAPFVGFMRVWANAVPLIQNLEQDEQDELARDICGLHPPQYHASMVNEIAAELCAVAIEISQRRSFQERFASDLQAVLDAEADGGNPSPTSTRIMASFVPPPNYDIAAPPPNYTPSVLSTRPSLKIAVNPGMRHSRSTSRRDHRLPPQSPGFLSPLSPYPDSARTPNSASFSPRTHRSSRSPSPSPSILAEDAPAIEFIRETLYASLADALERQPSLRRLLTRDRPRAYFAAVAFAILDVARNAITPDGSVIGVLGKPLTFAECPRDLQPLMAELDAIGFQAKAMEEEDNEVAMKLVQRGHGVPMSRLDRVKTILEEGIGYEEGLRDVKRDRKSNHARAIALANRINALSLRMTKLRAFREKQDQVFKVLAGIGS